MLSQCFSPTWKGRNGASALHEAVMTKNDQGNGEFIWFRKDFRIKIWTVYENHSKVVSSVLQKFPELINATDDRGDSVFHLATKLKLTMIFHTLVNQKNCCFCENRTRKCEGLCRENLRNADGKTYLDLCRKDEVDEMNVLQLLTSAGARKNKVSISGIEDVKFAAPASRNLCRSFPRTRKDTRPNC